MKLCQSKIISFLLRIGSYILIYFIISKYIYIYIYMYITASYILSYIWIFLFKKIFTKQLQYNWIYLGVGRRWWTKNTHWVILLMIIVYYMITLSVFIDILRSEYQVFWSSPILNCHPTFKLYTAISKVQVVYSHTLSTFLQ